MNENLEFVRDTVERVGQIFKTLHPTTTERHSKSKLY